MKKFAVQSNQNYLNQNFVARMPCCHSGKIMLRIHEFDSKKKQQNNKYRGEAKFGVNYRRMVATQ